MALLEIDYINSCEFWTVNHPEEGNSLGLRMWGELDQAATHLENRFLDPQEEPFSRRALIIEASPCLAKKPIWIAGGNLNELASLDTREKGADYATKMMRLCLRIKRLPIPVIMVLDGAAIGGGAEFAMSGDLRLGTQRSTFHFKQLTIGLSCGYGTTQELVKLLGVSRTTELLFLYEKIDAKKAASWGLFNKIGKDKNEVKGILDEILDRITVLDAQVIAAQKKMLLLDWENNKNVQRKELEIFSELWMKPAHQKSMKNFLEKKRTKQQG